MQVTFEIVTADDAMRAADVCEAIAQTLAGNVSQSDTPATSRRTRASRKAADPVASYNAIAAATGAAVIPTETAPAAPATEPPAAPVTAGPATPPPAAEPVPADPVSDKPTTPETTPLATGLAMSRDELIAATKALAIGLGVKWVKENITEKHGGRTMLSQLTDAEIAAVHAKAQADTAAKS